MCAADTMTGIVLETGQHHAHLTNNKAVPHASAFTVGGQLWLAIQVQVLGSTAI